MPTYDYACQNCGHELEVFQLMSAAPIVDCPSCDNPSLKRKIGTGAGLIFKGGGFYETDFKDKKGKADTTPAKEENSAKADSKPAAEKNATPDPKPATSAD